MKRFLFNCCILLLICSVTGKSQSSTFRYERPLVPGGPGPNRISPDMALLSGADSASLRDLRLFEPTGPEVPYLLIPPENPKSRWKAGSILRVAATKTTSGFEVDLGSASTIDRLLLAGIRAPFLKRFKLEGSGDRSHWTLLAAEGTLFDLPNENLRRLETDFTPGEYRYLRVTWDDRESGVVSEPRNASALLVERRTGPAPLRAGSVEFRRLSASQGVSRFQVKLPGPHLPIAAVELSVGESRLLRTARVTESRFSRGEIVSEALGSSELRRVVQGSLSASDLRIPIRAPEGREIEIAVEDGNNPPLNLTGVALEFSPQPWIYLESRTGTTLVARYGSPRLEAPKYDLEAVRQYIGRTDLKEARWGDVRDSQSEETAVDSVLQPQAGAAIDPMEFRYSRKIPESSGLTALLLDAGVLAHSRSDLSDLRIADESNHQIPYLLEKRPDTFELNLPLSPEKTGGSEKESHYHLELPFENLPQAKLILNTTERTFQRKIAVEIQRPASDPRSQPVMETVASAIWRHNDPEIAAPPLFLDLPSSLGTTSATVVVDEGDNHPLALGTTRLELPLYRVRFFYPADAKLRLLYGNDGLSAPRYDLELLAPRLVGVSGKELALDPEARAPIAPPGRIPVKLFWAALVVAVLVVLALLVRLLRSENPASNA